MQQEQCLNDVTHGEPLHSFCEEFYSQRMLAISRYEGLVRDHRLSLLKNWVLTLDIQRQQHIRFCYGEVNQIQLQQHSRIIQMLDTVPPIDRPSCEAILRPFYGDTLVKEFSQESLRESVVLSPDDRVFINDFRNSPEGRVMNDLSLHRNDQTENQLKDELKRVYAQLQSDVYLLMGKISDLQTSNKYRLYSLQSEFQSYVAALPASEREKANHCYERSIVFIECRNISAGQCLLRSFLRPMNFILDYTPILAALRLYTSGRIGENRAAFNLGLQSLREFNANQFEITSQIVANFPALGAALPSATLRMTPTVLRASGSLSLLKSPPRVTQRTIEHILQRHPPTPYEGLTRSLDDSVESLSANAALREYIDERVLTIRHLNDVIDSPRLSREAIDQAKVQRGEIYNDITSRMAEHFPNIDRRAPSSLFPENFNIREFLSHPNLRSNLISITPDGKQSLHRIEVDDLQVEVWICNIPPCNRGGVTVRTTNEVLTAYPCGPNAKGFRGLRRVIQVLADEGRSAATLRSEDFIIQTHVCTSR